MDPEELVPAPAARVVIQIVPCALTDVVALRLLPVSGIGLLRLLELTLFEGEFS